jgi:S1-C subfamily serine protease
MQIGAGETVDATIIRDGERLTLPLTLGERPQRP